MADQQVQLSSKVDELSHQMQSLSNSVLKRVDDQLASITSKLDEQLNLFTASCSPAAVSIHKSNSGTMPVTSASSATPAVDRYETLSLLVSRRAVFLTTGVMSFHVFLRLHRVGMSTSMMHFVLEDSFLVNVAPFLLN